MRTGEGRCISRPFYGTGHVIESDLPGLPRIQMRSSHCDECAPDTRPIVGLNFCDVGNLEEQIITVLR